jgi:hypothetical protein
MRPNQIHAVLCAGHNTTLVCSQGRHSVWPSSNHVRNRGKPHACHTDTDAMVAGSEMRLQGRAVALHSMATRTFKAHTQATTVLLVRKPAHVCTHTHTHTHTQHDYACTNLLLPFLLFFRALFVKQSHRLLLLERRGLRNCRHPRHPRPHS